MPFGHGLQILDHDAKTGITMQRKISMLSLVLFCGSVALPAFAETETCKQCKFAKCIKSSILQKEALATAYDALAKKWDKFWVRRDGDKLVPIDSIDLESLDMVARGPTLSNLARDYTQFAKDEEAIVLRIATPVGCGYDGADVEMSTNIIGCNIDLDKARQAEKAMPCKELHEIAFRHEALHLGACLKRKGDNNIPPVRLTPAGKAREEAQAYTREIGELKSLLLKVGCKGELNYQGTTILNIPSFMSFRIVSSAHLSFSIDEATHKITGEGTQIVAIEPISSGHCTANAGQSEYEWNIGGQEENDFLLFKFLPRSKTTLPNIGIIRCRIKGNESYGFSYPVNFNIGDIQIEKKDGATREIDFSSITGGATTGKATITLRLYQEE